MSHRGKYSPTVVKALIQNRSWFKTYCEQYGCETDNNRIFDIEGFDQFGYDRNGIDRAGNSQEDYQSNPYYDVNDDLLDSGEELAFKAIHSCVGDHLLEPGPEIYVQAWSAEDVIEFYLEGHQAIFPSQIDLKEV